MSTKVTRGPFGSESARSRQPGQHDLVRAWVANVAAFAVALAAAIWGPKPGDPVIWLVVQLTVIVAIGLGGSVVAVWFSARALRLGRQWATAPLLVAAFLVLQSLLRVTGTLGRFYGWG